MADKKTAIVAASVELIDDEVAVAIHKTEEIAVNPPRSFEEYYMDSQFGWQPAWVSRDSINDDDYGGSYCHRPKDPPLKRFLFSQVGRQWDEVFSRICRSKKWRSQRYSVDVYVRLNGNSLSNVYFFVDEKGILCLTERGRKFAAKQEGSRQKSCKQRCHRRPRFLSTH